MKAAMKITDEQVARYQEIFDKKYGVIPTKEQSAEELQRLVRLMEIVYQPITKDDLESMKKQREIAKRNI